MNKMCWYILKGSEVVGVADAPVNEEDLNSRGLTVVVSNVYEPVLGKIARMEGNVPVLKPVINLEVNKAPDGTLLVTPKSSNYTENLNVLVYGTPFPVKVGETLSVVPLEGYSAGISVQATEDIYVEYMGGAV